MIPKYCEMPHYIPEKRWEAVKNDFHVVKRLGIHKKSDGYMVQCIGNRGKTMFMKRKRIYIFRNSIEIVRNDTEASRNASVYARKTIFKE